MGQAASSEALGILLGIALVVLIGPLTIYKFTVDSPLEVLNDFPEKQASSIFVESDRATLFTELAGWLEQQIDNAAVAGAGAFDGITASVRSVLDALQYAAKGPGLLGGFAILFVAMVLDRIVQGAFRREDQK
ncbi:MAG: hypothetical protein OXN16_07915 [Gammaproteobacteria bacterium]|nr:hypothetical protein [Gammaproteobacteria bacterium]